MVQETNTPNNTLIKYESSIEMKIMKKDFYCLAMDEERLILDDIQKELS